MLINKCYYIIHTVTNEILMCGSCLWEIEHVMVVEFFPLLFQHSILRLTKEIPSIKIIHLRMKQHPKQQQLQQNDIIINKESNLFILARTFYRTIKNIEQQQKYVIILQLEFMTCDCYYCDSLERKKNIYYIMLLFYSFLDFSMKFKYNAIAYWHAWISCLDFSLTNKK